MGDWSSDVCSSALFLLGISGVPTEMPSKKPGGGGTWGRTRSSGRSSWPRWAPAAPAASATSTRSLTITGMARAPTRVRVRAATSRGGAPLNRTWTMVAPPRAACRHSATGSRPLRSAASVTTIKRNRSARAMTKTLRGLRGATTAAANTRAAILDATAELLRALQDANGFRPEDVESAIFTSSPDLTAEYPARAARLLGWTDVPLLGAAEVAVPDGLSRCVRVLLHFYTAKPQRELKHMYLRDAAKLRPDR